MSIIADTSGRIDLTVKERYTFGTYINEDAYTVTIGDTVVSVDELVEWQKADYDSLCEKTYSANWSEMGCFKTTTGLWLMADRAKAYAETNINPNLLIITTKSGKGTYFDAIPKTIQGYRVFDIQATKVQEILFGGELRFNVSLEEWSENMNADAYGPTIVLAHYHCFMNKSQVLPILRRMMWAFILCDEAHKLKNKDGQWTRNIKTLRTLNGDKHVMTGTGFINRPDEIWSLLNFLDNKIFSSYKRFRQYFCDEIEIGGYTKVLGVKPEKIEEFRKIRKALGPRREMREVHKDIAAPIFTPRTVDLNPVQRKMYNEIKAELRAMDKNGVAIYSPNVLSQLNRLRQICVATPEVVSVTVHPETGARVQEIKLTEPSSKLDELMDILEELEWNDERRQQVVVFSNFTGPLLLLRERLREAEIPFMWMQAAHKDDERYRMWHDEWPKKIHRVFMSTLQLGSESINLSSAEHVVFLDRSWSPKDNSQGIARVFRPGQTGATQVININAKSTTDQRMERVDQIKTGWFKSIFGEDE